VVRSYIVHPSVFARSALTHETYYGFESAIELSVLLSGGPYQPKLPRTEHDAFVQPTIKNFAMKPQGAQFRRWELWCMRIQIHVWHVSES
jgi:hypothetical protein